VANGIWALGTAVVATVVLAIGVLLGWFCRGALALHREQDRDHDIFDELLQRNEELFRAIFSVLGQWRDLTRLLGELRRYFQELQASTATGNVRNLIDSMDQLNGDLTTSHERLQRHLDLSRKATATARRVIHSTSVIDSACGSEEPVCSQVKTNAALRGMEGDSSAQSLPEVRQEERTPYRRQQKVAPYMPGQIPKLNMFRTVQCWDLSSRGISYFTTQRPESKLIVITIGDEPDLVYRTARVVHAAEVQIGEQSKGAFRVGCEFTGRLHRHLFA
jgi:hypothetical protein